MFSEALARAFGVLGRNGKGLEMFGSRFLAAPSFAEGFELFDPLQSGADAGRRRAEKQLQAQRQRRDMADALLYDFALLQERSRLALENAEPGAVLVAHPQEERPVSVYPDAERWALSLDRGARILALVGPGSSAEAAAAFARQAADALGEKVVGLAPPRSSADLMLDLSAPLSSALPRPSWADASERREMLRALLEERSGGFALIATHRLGGRWLREAGASGGARIVTIGGAAASAGREDALHLLGAQDFYGWSISDQSQLVRRIAPFAGGHLNPAFPCSFPLAESLREAAADLGAL